jgi:hypothetical protein
MAHENETLPAADEGPVQRTVRPCAWAAFTPEGNIRVWTSAPEEVRKLAERVGFELTPLYGPDAMAAERERCAKLCEGMHDEDRPSDYAWAIRTEWADDSTGPNAEFSGTPRRR